jgi:signal peptidase II
MQKAAKGKWLLGVSLALMLGGAIGNFIDRVVRKEVVDFIHTYIFTYNFPVFNIADSALVVGVIVLMIQMLLEERESKEKLHGENGTHHT